MTKIQPNMTVSVFSFLGICLFLSFILSSIATAAKTNSEQTTLNITAQHGLISVQSQSATLPEMLRAVSEKTGIKVYIRDEDFLNKSFWSFADLPLVDAIRLLVGNHNMAITFKKTDSSLTVKNIDSVWVFANPVLSSPKFEPALAANISTAKKTHNHAVDDLTNPDPQVRISAIQTLTALQEPETAPILAQAMLEEADASVREQIGASLEKITGQGAAVIMENGLGDADYLVRTATVRFLAQTETDRVAPSLGQVLFNDPDPLLRLEAVLAIAQHHSAAARAFLQVAAKDEDSMVSEAATFALSQAY